MKCMELTNLLDLMNKTKNEILVKLKSKWCTKSSSIYCNIEFARSQIIFYKTFQTNCWEINLCKITSNDIFHPDSLSQDISYLKFPNHISRHTRCERNIESQCRERHSIHVNVQFPKRNKTYRFDYFDMSNELGTFDIWSRLRNTLASSHRYCFLTAHPREQPCHFSGRCTPFSHTFELHVEQ